MSSSSSDVRLPLLVGEQSMQLLDKEDKVKSRFATTWKKDFAGEYDFCIVFPAVNGDFTKKGSGYIHSLKSLGFELFIFKNIRRETEIIVLIRTPLEKLRAFADKIDFVMKLDSKVIQRMIESGDPEHGIAAVEIQHLPDITPLHPYENIYGKYSRNVNESIYWKEPDMTHPFRDIIRLKLTALILESRLPNGGENLKIRRYIRSGWLKACFPLHNRAKTENLHIEWQKFPFKAQPLNEIKEYFGEKIAMYFNFMEHYISYLCIPAVVGLPLQIAVIVMNNFSGT
jgi:hypothetical protein